MYRNCVMKNYKEIRSVVCFLYYLFVICFFVSWFVCKKIGKSMNYIDKILFEWNFLIILGFNFLKKKKFL